jgi:uncharacterized cupin superfamily protein
MALMTQHTFVAGKLVVQMKGGNRETFCAGDAFHIPPGHDAFVEGDEEVRSERTLPQTLRQQPRTESESAVSISLHHRRWSS